MELPGTLWERASTALQRLKKLPNLVCLSTLAGLGRRFLFTPQLRHLFDQCATKHRHKAREADLQRWAQLVSRIAPNTTSPCTAPHATRKHTPSPRALRVD